MDKKLKTIKYAHSQKNYYLKHKEDILKKACEKVECQICGKMVSRQRLMNHIKTKLCKNLCDYKKRIAEK